MAKQILAKTNATTGDIEINLSLVYDAVQDDDAFIDIFSSLMQHEQIHRAIGDAYSTLNISERKRLTKYLEGEEWAVRLLCNQKFNKGVRSEYKREGKRNANNKKCKGPKPIKL